jgi:signal transduction histidine kinase/ligand-binding sensor domain-containing protein/AraC-like DNA-binding protein
VLLLAIATMLYANESSPYKSLLFETVTSNGENINSRILTVYQDPFGFIWFGSDYGLFRYDGYRVDPIISSDIENSSLLGIAGIEVIVSGADSSMWIGTNMGLFNLNLRNWEIIRPKQYRNQIIRSLMNQGDSILWVGTSQGLFNYDQHSGKSVFYNNVNSNLSQNTIRALYLDQSRSLWVGTADKLNRLRYGREVFETFDLKGDYKPNIKHNLILDIKPFSERNDSLILVGTETGLCLFNTKTLQAEIISSSSHELTNEVVKTIYSINEQEIYIGTDQGLNKLNLKTNRVEQYYHYPFDQYSITSNQIWKIYPDNSGNIWIGTSNGISKLNISNTSFSYYPVYIEKNLDQIGTIVTDLVKDKGNKTWISTSSGLLFTSDQTDGRLHQLNIVDEELLSINNINVLKIDGRNRLWIGSVAGINIWDISKEKVYIPSMDDGTGTRVSSNYISTIFEGNDQTFWIGTWGGGLYKADAGINETEKIELQYVGDLNGQNVIGDENLWAISGNTLSKFSFQTESLVNLGDFEESIGSAPFLSLCYASNEIIWIGSKSQLLKYEIASNTIEIVTLPVEEVLFVTGIIEDDDGIIWGSSTDKIFRYDPVGKGFNLYPIPANIPLKKLIPSPFRKANDKQLIVCGFDGYLKFSPQELFINEEDHHVIISSIEVNGESLFPGKEIKGRSIITENISKISLLELPHSSRNIKIEFTTLSYQDMGQERYSFILEGFDSRWRLNESGTSAVDYVNLPPGKYTFKVRSLSASDTAQFTSLAIKVRYQFWTHPLMYILYGLLFLSVIGIMFIQYRNRLRIRSQLDNMQIEKEQIEQQNASKLKFYINISHELLTPISLIIDPLKQILRTEHLEENLRKSLTLMERNANFLKTYINQLLNFRKIEIGHTIGHFQQQIEIVSFCQEIVESLKGNAISKGVSLKLKSDVSQMRIQSDEEKLFSIIQNLLSNAIKFTPENGDVTLLIKVKSKHEFIIVVKDNGIGIESTEQEKVFERFYKVKNEKIESKGLGIGLTIVRDFVEVLNGSINLKSEIGKGTRVQVTFPSMSEISMDTQTEAYEKEYVNQKTITGISDSNIKKLTSVIGLPIILVVDAISDMYDYIDSYLYNKYNIVWASSARKALDIVSKKEPTIIISEIQLPDIDGINFCRKVRNNAKTSHIPIILLTSKIEIEHHVKGIEAGADVFLSKPFDIEILEANISNLIRKIVKTEELISRHLLLNEQEISVESKDDKLLKEVVEYIHNNITDSRILATDISHSLGISHSNLYRRIKSITGQSLNEFIRFVRLKKAEQLLKTGKFTVSEVMYQVGFTNHSYFSKCFKKLYNVSPKSFNRE